MSQHIYDQWPWQMSQGQTVHCTYTRSSESEIYDCTLKVRNHSSSTLYIRRSLSKVLFSIFIVFYHNHVFWTIYLRNVNPSRHDVSAQQHSRLLVLEPETPGAILCQNYMYILLSIQIISKYFKLLKRLRIEQSKVLFIINFHFPVNVLELAVNYKT